MRAALAVLAACGATSTPARVNNQTTATRCHVRGMVVDTKTGKPLVEAIVLLDGGLGDELAITDRNGMFDVKPLRHHESLTVFFVNDQQTTAMLGPNACTEIMMIRLVVRSWVESRVII